MEFKTESPGEGFIDDERHVKLISIAGTKVKIQAEVY